VTAPVNLLPARYAERIVERRWTGAVAGGLLLLLLLLGLLGLGQSRRLARAESQRATEQVRTQQLTARRTELVPFRELAEGIITRERLLSQAMHTQISWSGVLAGLSAVFPPDATLTSFTAESLLPALAEGSQPEPGSEASIIGTVTFNGYATFDTASTEDFAPGVSATLQALRTVTGLSDPQLVLGARGEIGEVPVTTFEGAALVDGAALTGRFAGGLPAGERVEVPQAPAAAPGVAALGGGTGSRQ
jgi:Tfp pilus assembly protein PilN